MEAAASPGRSVSVSSQPPSRKEWRVVSEHPVRNGGNEVTFEVLHCLNLFIY